MYWWDLPGGPAVRLHASNAGGTGLILVGEVRSHICPMVCTPPPPPKKVLMNFSERWSCLAVQCSRSVMSDTLRPHGLQHARLACPSPTPRVYSNSCPLSWWCHPSNHLILCHPFLLPPSIFPSSGSFPMSQFFASGGQTIGISTSISVLSVNIQDWFPLGWSGWISLQSNRLSRAFSNTTKSINSLALSFLYSPTLTSIYDHWKNHSLE